LVPGIIKSVKKLKTKISNLEKVLNVKLLKQLTKGFNKNSDKNDWLAGKQKFTPVLTLNNIT